MAMIEIKDDEIAIIISADGCGHVCFRRRGAVEPNSSHVGAAHYMVACLDEFGPARLVEMSFALNQGGDEIQ